MNAHKHLIVFGALLTSGSALLLAACEGEPPIAAPENPPGAASDNAAATAVSSEDAAASPPVAPAMTASRPVPSSSPDASCASMPCAPAHAAASAAAPETSAVSAGASPSPTPSSQAAVARGNIVGTVTTTPAAVRGQAVVYLEDGPNEEPAIHPRTVTITNRQMNFVPFVAAVPAGAKVAFANDDPFPHNVFSPDNEKFNMGNIAQNSTHVRAFKTAGSYSLLCNLHPGMLGYLLVTPSGWFARTDAKGNFAIKNVPDGTYKVTAWAPRQSPVTAAVTVAEGDATLHFDLHR